MLQYCEIIGVDERATVKLILQLRVFKSLVFPNFCSNLDFESDCYENCYTSHSYTHTRLFLKSNARVQFFYAHTGVIC